MSTVCHAEYKCPSSATKDGIKWEIHQAVSVSIHIIQNITVQYMTLHLFWSFYNRLLHAHVIGTDGEATRRTQRISG